MIGWRAYAVSLIVWVAIITAAALDKTHDMERAKSAAAVALLCILVGDSWERRKGGAK